MANESSTHDQDYKEHAAQISSQNSDTLDSGGEKTKKDRSDAHRSKTRRKREGGRSRTSRDVETKIDSLKITNSENVGAGNEKKERRSRSSRGEEDKEVRSSRRSISRSRRKVRGQRSSATKPVDSTEITIDEDDKKIPRTNSVRNIFNRKQGTEDP